MTSQADNSSPAPVNPADKKRHRLEAIGGALAIAAFISLGVGIYRWYVSRSAKVDPQVTTVGKLLLNGYGDNRHVRIKGCRVNRGVTYSLGGDQYYTMDDMVHPDTEPPKGKYEHVLLDPRAFAAWSEYEGEVTLQGVVRPPSSTEEEEFGKHGMHNLIVFVDGRRPASGTELLIYLAIVVGGFGFGVWLVNRPTVAGPAGPGPAGPSTS